MLKIISIHSRDENDLEQNVNILYQMLEEIQLMINFSKTETMFWNLNESNDSTYIF